MQKGGFFEGDNWKPWYWGAEVYDAPSLKEALFMAYKDGREGQTIKYKNKAYKVLLSPSDLKEYQIQEQHQQNRSITNDQVVDGYMNNVMYTMENPKSRGFRDGKWYPYTDKDIKGNVHYNLGPGINKNSEVGSKLDYSGKVGYTTEQLNSALRPDLMNKMEGITSDLRQMDQNSDTMSLGNRMILLDISHNVRPRGNKRANMPSAWPSLVKSMQNGNTQGALNQMNSGSSRRQEMRGDLLWKNTITQNTVRNR